MAAPLFSFAYEGKPSFIGITTLGMGCPLQPPKNRTNNSSNNNNKTKLDPTVKSTIFCWSRSDRTNRRNPAALVLHCPWRTRGAPRWIQSEASAVAWVREPLFSSLRRAGAKLAFPLNQTEKGSLQKPSAYTSIHILFIYVYK